MSARLRGKALLWARGWGEKSMELLVPGEKKKKKKSQLFWPFIFPNAATKQLSPGGIRIEIPDAESPDPSLPAAPNHPERAYRRDPIASSCWEKYVELFVTIGLLEK